MDVELAVDAMRLGRALDHFIIFSGRAELKALVSALQEEGKRVTVVSSLANGSLLRMRCDARPISMSISPTLRIKFGSRDLQANQTVARDDQANLELVVP